MDRCQASKGCLSPWALLAAPAGWCQELQLWGAGQSTLSEGMAGPRISGLGLRPLGLPLATPTTGAAAGQ